MATQKATISVGSDWVRISNGLTAATNVMIALVDAVGNVQLEGNTSTAVPTAPFAPVPLTPAPGGIMRAAGDLFPDIAVTEIFARTTDGSTRNVSVRHA